MNKPTVIAINDLSEGIYAASGKGCYTASAYIHQKPEIGRGDYRIQINGIHKAQHTKETQYLQISFNLPVIYKSSNGQYLNGSNTNTLLIQYNYHQNPNDNIGLGDLCVEANEGLIVTNIKITD